MEPTMPTIRRAIDDWRKLFPFRDYMNTELAEERYAELVGAVLRHVPAGGSVLDFGAGPCDTLGILRQLGFSCAACDDLMDPWHQGEGAREKILAYTRAAGIDFRKIEGPGLPFHEPVFDLVMMHDVLEHLHDSPRELLNDMLALAKPEGLFFTTVPNAVNLRKRLAVLRGRTNLPAYDGFYWTPGPWRGHVREYTRGDLESLCEYLGLDIVELRAADHMLDKLSPLLRRVYRSATSWLPGLKDTWLLVGRKRRGWAPRRTASEL
jgi:SAM-dependent methyltransferase